MNETIHINPEAAEFARRELLRWYDTAARTFPWRNEIDPYHVLMAEMMLRRTQAKQVIPVYHQFISRYPDVESLDQAPADEVAEILRPLGLGWRVDNFKILARQIVTRHQGRVPRDRQELLALTGVGPYVADAIRSFSFHEPSVIVDTNTVRVAARYFGFDYNPESRRRKAVIQAVSHLITRHEPARSNYALLDFAALVCRARDPLHNTCPLASYCAYFRKLMDAQAQKNATSEHSSESILGCEKN